MAKSKTGEFKMDKPYGLTMRGIVKNSNDEILILRRQSKIQNQTPTNGNTRRKVRPRRIFR